VELYADEIQISYGKRVIVDNLSVQIPEGKITALIGANGSGKSTILKTMCRIMQPSRGAVILDGKSIHNQPGKEIARLLTVLPQNPESPEGLTVRELVSYGRNPYKKGFSLLNQEDQDIIDWALEMTHMKEFEDRSLMHLSGGQRQRAWIAMAVAQNTDVLFLDEPTTFLDMAHQLEVLKLLKKINEQHKRTIVMIVHDLNHASRYADHIVAIKKGTIVAEGSPKDVVTQEICKQVFGIEADIVYDPRTNAPLCLPYEVTTVY